MSGLPYKVEGERVNFSLRPVLVKEVSPEDWEKRDPKATHIPKGEVVIQVDASSLPLDIGSFMNIKALIDEGQAHAFLVVDHSLESDAKPVVREIGKGSLSVALALLPIGYEALAEETQIFLNY